tara:strand:+ start:1845 stop:2312 length:468 start_codon:yes stop_codon:yes gene_type:complete
MIALNEHINSISSDAGLEVVSDGGDRVTFKTGAKKVTTQIIKNAKADQVAKYAKRYSAAFIFVSLSDYANSLPSGEVLRLFANATTSFKHFCLILNKAGFEEPGNAGISGNAIKDHVMKKAPMHRSHFVDFLDIKEKSNVKMVIKRAFGVLLDVT